MSDKLNYETFEKRMGINFDSKDQGLFEAFKDDDGFIGKDIFLKFALAKVPNYLDYKTVKQISGGYFDENDEGLFEAFKDENGFISKEIFIKFALTKTTSLPKVPSGPTPPSPPREVMLSISYIYIFLF